MIVTCRILIPKFLSSCALSANSFNICMGADEHAPNQILSPDSIFFAASSTDSDLLDKSNPY
ncbi:hypothetical protein CLHOM_33800 [Clostridium homopropionicum DSM 5847]|uniref:Uncharacterized protein n=1 Tax=Clostridium homopropionicum DSM 5847 TaxID=1121318 RepID=A0A0L6Z6N3_9CLOT|nr:hypothetical protein [Clostridium homopropionicum]KOA18478.1 hypothetical protein CLHOM_33800 [Clostridium homopropionicum DSM 5847]SFF66127.1 hypothetical protein SAMN04488501_101100 [Clostridium homopropionicum]